MIRAQNFAKDTGDYTSLSLVDQQVIALGIRVAREKGEIDSVRMEPQDLTEFRPKNFEADYAKLYDSDSDSEDSEEEASDRKKFKAAVDDGDGWNEVPEDRQVRKTRENKERKRKRWEEK